MRKAIKNWLDSAQYDLKTAESLLKTKRKIYVIFMCHLAIEKMLKAIVSAKTNKMAPYTHNLLYLLNMVDLKLPPKLMKFIEVINDKSVPTRYPEDIAKMARQVSLKSAGEYLKMTKETIKWLRQNTSCLK